jgi:hypothetical protein
MSSRLGRAWRRVLADDSSDTIPIVDDSPDTSPDIDASPDSTPGRVDQVDTTPDDGETNNENRVKGSKMRGRGHGKKKGHG